MDKKGTKKIFIGWDIGGANTKVSIIRNNSSSFNIYRCHLWESLDSLKQLVNSICRKYKEESDVINIITMSGEMCDIFETRDKGVKKILNIFEHVTNENYIFSSSKPFFHKLKKKHNTRSISSMNWFATAMFLETKVQNAIAIDIGSTTTDIMIIKNGRCKNKNFDDFSRLSSSELIYTGVFRTPINALTNQIVINKTRYCIIPESFADMSDIYRILYMIDPKKDYSETCDYRSRTHKNSLKRLSRALGFDYSVKYENILKKISEKIKLIQISMLTNKILGVMKNNFIKSDSINFVGLGIGRFLVKKICNENKIPYKDFNSFCKDNKKSELFLPSDLAPAYSISMLFKYKNERT